MKIFFVCLGLMVFMGCAKLEHLDQLLTLKDLSDEGDRLDKYVQAQDSKFELLVGAVKKNTLKRNSHKNKILKIFGDPVYTEEISKDGQKVQQWLYRYAKNFFDGEKVYLYFDARENLIDYEYIPAVAARAVNSKE